MKQGAAARRQGTTNPRKLIQMTFAPGEPETGAATMGLRKDSDETHIEGPDGRWGHFVPRSAVAGANLGIDEGGTQAPFARGRDREQSRDSDDHATTIDAPPSAVWPWLIQMGWHQGGWYTKR